MPRKKFVASSEFVYHVTGRCINKEWFSIPLDEVWDLCSNYLFFIHHAYGVRIHSFVLMQNHFHLLVRTPESNLDEAMNYFMRETSKIMARRCGRINQIYGGPYGWTIIKEGNYFLNAYKYVYRNPIRAGLIGKAEAYRYSTLQGLLGFSHTVIPVVEDDTLFSGIEDQLTWINTDYRTVEDEEDIKKALRKREFKFARTKDGRPHALETTLG